MSCTYTHSKSFKFITIVHYIATATASSQPNHHSEPKSTPAATRSKDDQPTTTIAHNSNHPLPSHHIDKPDASAHKPSIAPATPTPSQQHHHVSSSSSANHHNSNKSVSQATASTSHQHHHSLNAVSPVNTPGSKSTTSSTTSTSSSSSTPSSSNTMLPSSQQKNEGLSGGAVTAIVIVVLIGLAGLIMWVVMRKKKRRAMLRGQAQAQQPDPFTMGFGSHDPPPHTAYNMASSHDTSTGASPMIQMPPIGASSNTSNVPPPHPHPPVAVGGAGNDAPTYYSYNSVSAQEGTIPHAIGVFTVISTYTPTLSDELDIQPGDRVEILIEYDDGWCQGINLSRGNLKGVFPRHCCQYNTQQQYYEPANMKRVSSMYMSPHQNAQQQKAYYL